MKTKKTLLFAALTLALLAVALVPPVVAQAKTDKPTSNQQRTIIVGTQAYYTPFEMVKNDKMVGLDIDLVKAIVRRTGYKVEFQSSPWEDLLPGLIPGLGATQFDMVASAMTIIGPREEFVDFSDPYINANQCLIVAADSAITSTDGLEAGDTIAVLTPGSTGEMWAAANLELESRGVALVRCENIMTGFQALKQGTIDGVIYPIPETQYILFKDPSLGAKIVEEIFAGPLIGEAHELYAFVFPENSPLRAVVNGGLQQIMDDGTYAEIYRKWLGVEPWPMPL